MALIRIFIFPFSLMYGVITWFRNKLFDWKILPSKSFLIPVISVGNLSAGGTGKTPHVEYLINLLREDYKMSTLSRGYKRKSKNFVLADINSTVDDIGDEPFQFKTKYHDLTVAVDERRIRGIEQLIKKKNPDIILLDDAFQHRYVKPGLSILLTDFYKLYSNDYLLPTGSLREFRMGAKRADIIVVTKSPKVLSPITRKQVVKALKPTINQKVYFSFVKHGKLKQIPGLDFVPDQQCTYSSILMVTGVANPYPLEQKLRSLCTHLEKEIFPDHHRYTEFDVIKLIEKFNGIFTKNKIIVTTEKDMGRLIQPVLLEKLKSVPICYMPIEVKFHKDDKQEFETQIIDYVKKAKRNH